MFQPLKFKNFVMDRPLLFHFDHIQFSVPIFSDDILLFGMDYHRQKRPYTFNKDRLDFAGLINDRLLSKDRVINV